MKISITERNRSQKNWGRKEKSEEKTNENLNQIQIIKISPHLAYEVCIKNPESFPAARFSDQERSAARLETHRRKFQTDRTCDRRGTPSPSR